MKGTSITLLGAVLLPLSFGTRPHQGVLVARLHFSGYVKVDAFSPGPDGYVLWTRCGS